MCSFSLLTRFKTRRELEGEKAHGPIFMELYPYGVQSEFFPPSGLKLGRAFEMQPVLWKRFSSEIWSPMRTILGVFFFPIIGIRATNCAWSCLIWISSRLSISTLSSPVCHLLSPVPSWQTQRWREIISGYLADGRQVVVCVCWMPFIWRSQRAWCTLWLWQGPALT